MNGFVAIRGHWRGTPTNSAIAGDVPTWSVSPVRTTLCAHHSLPPSQCTHLDPLYQQRVESLSSPWLLVGELGEVWPWVTVSTVSARREEHNFFCVAQLEDLDALGALLVVDPPSHDRHPTAASSCSTSLPLLVGVGNTVKESRKGGEGWRREWPGRRISPENRR
ncbi:hypothetical protein E2562_036718 [Oryza meyeriana var. granulata]|uniref:Uncharacterized protein n=1 Tax=Oryza meyeriana var. granulata TaxID=110450 RepID=A0A6G1CL88_9ORYZ|nr:hypothetical protein E2562_036718 [Oryza meyeriana var. granulata]